jgi:tetratricopeptide (TPR) repeat protein
MQKNNQPTGVGMGNSGFVPDKSVAKAQKEVNQFGEFKTPRAKPGTPLKPETEVAFADTEVEAAFSENRGGAERDQLLDDARQRYQRALKADPKHAGAYLGLARMYGKCGEAEHSVTMYRQYLDMNPRDHKVAHELAAVYFKAGDYGNCVAACEFALKIDAENKQYTKTMGLALARAGRYDEGYATMAKVMGEAGARFYVARTMEHNGEMELCKQQVALVLKADPNYPGAREYFAYLNGEALPQPNAIQQTGATDRN